MQMAHTRENAERHIVVKILSGSESKFWVLVISSSVKVFFYVP